MERRYLVAALAIIATFAVTSRGFQAVQRIAAATDHDQHFWTLAKVGAMAKARCEASSAARAVARVRTHLRPRIPEEAQLLAEMNVPVIDLQGTFDDQVARQDTAIARCAREHALREAERARHEALRLQEKMSREMSAPPNPISALPPDFDQRIRQQTAAMASQITANQIKLQLATAKLRDNAMAMAVTSAPDVDVWVDTPAVGASPQVHCKVKTSQHSQTKHKMMYYTFATQ